MQYVCRVPTTICFGSTDMIQKGSKGNDVLLWQKFLKEKKFFNGEPEGSFGDFSAKATMAFQKANNLPQSGAVDEATLKVAAAQGFKLPAPAASKALTKEDVIAAATAIKVAPAAMQAVCVVESSGSGFFPDGRAKIRFEGHIFWKELSKRNIKPEDYAAKNPDIVFKDWTREFYKNSAEEYGRLEAAQKINTEAANASASWGMFQIMGFNYKSAGFSSVAAFVDAMQKSEKEHLKAFCAFISSLGYIPWLQSKNWLEFAKHYNGAHWQENKYDQKLATAYNDAVKSGWQG